MGRVIQLLAVMACVVGSNLMHTVAARHAQVALRRILDQDDGETGGGQGHIFRRDAEPGGEEKVGAEVNFRIFMETTEDAFWGSEGEFRQALAEVAQIEPRAVVIVQVLPAGNTGTGTRRLLLNSKILRIGSEASTQDVLPVQRRRQRSQIRNIQERWHKQGGRDKCWVWVTLLVNERIGTQVAARLEPQALHDALERRGLPTPLAMSEITVVKQLNWSMKGVPEAEGDVPANDSFQEEEDEDISTNGKSSVLMGCIYLIIAICFSWPFLRARFARKWANPAVAPEQEVVQLPLDPTPSAPPLPEVRRGLPTNAESLGAWGSDVHSADRLFSEEQPDHGGPTGERDQGRTPQDRQVQHELRDEREGPGQEHTEDDNDCIEAPSATLTHPTPAVESDAEAARGTLGADRSRSHGSRAAAQAILPDDETETARERMEPEGEPDSPVESITKLAHSQAGVLKADSEPVPGDGAHLPGATAVALDDAPGDRRHAELASHGGQERTPGHSRLAVRLAENDRPQPELVASVRSLSS